ncbi:MAG: NADPH-dependent F420 reductase [Myxococcales bacterium]|nr:NADPH-dependent F420 reductase [Myxococcales bacterium]
MKIAFIGAGNVGAALADRFARTGHQVTLAQGREGSESVAKALARNPSLVARPIEAAVDAAEVVCLATPFQAVAGIVKELGSRLAGKILVDCTNPVGPGLSHGLESKRSGTQVIQELAPDARVIKAFTIYGYENLENPAFPAYNVKPTMMFCGDDPQAKQQVARLIEDTGFAPLDVGGLAQALHLEHMTLLWVRLVRVDKHSPHLVWAALER